MLVNAKNLKVQRALGMRAAPLGRARGGHWVGTRRRSAILIKARYSGLAADLDGI
jgi:hypothetical protein